MEHPADDGHISLQGVLTALNTYRVMVVGFVAAGTIAATLGAFLLPPVYRSDVLLSPVTDDGDAGRLSGLASQLGGLAALAGVSMRVGSGNKDEAVALLKSRTLTERFIEKEDLLPLLFEKKWDRESKRWDVDDPSDVPTMGDAYRLWDKSVRRVAEDRKTGLVTLTIEWKDPHEAARWAMKLVALVNATMSERAVTEATNSVSYLNAELRKTSVVEVQQAIFRLMEAQVKIIMMANVRQEYSFRIVDPAVVADLDDYVRPRRMLMIVMGFLVGTFGGIFVAVTRDGWMRRSPGLRPE